MLQDEAAETTPRPIRMNEDGANFCVICLRIEELILAVGTVVAAKQGFAVAPSAASDNSHRSFGVRNLRHEVVLVGDQLRIQPQSMTESPFDLGGRVVVRLEAPHRLFDEVMEGRDIRTSRTPKLTVFESRGHLASTLAAVAVTGK